MALDSSPSNIPEFANLRDAARAAVKLVGFVIKLAPGCKTPVEKGPLRLIPAGDVWDEWTNDDGSPADYNVGIPMGYGFVALDVDKANGNHTIDGWSEAEKLGILSEATYQQVSAADGRHAVYDTSGCPQFSQADLAPGINVRSAGGYIVAAGSRLKNIPDKHPAGVYRVHTKLKPKPLPEHLKRLLTIRGTEARFDESSYSGEWDHPHSVERCWQYIRDEAPRAVKGNRGRTGLGVAHMLGDRAILKDTALEMLHEWHETKCNPPEDDTNQMEHVLNSAYSNRQRSFGIDCTHEWLTAVEVPVSASDWPKADMTLVTARVLPPPALPLDAFGPVAPLIADIAASRCAPPDYPAAGLLAISSSLIGTTRCVKAWDSWPEMLSLFCIAVGTPAQSKTPSISPLLEPVRRIEGRLVAAARAQSDLYEVRKQVWETQQAAWRDAARAAIEANQEPPAPPTSIPPEPPSGRLLVEDSSPEKVAQILSKQPRGLLWWRDELSALLGSVGQAGGRDARGFLLELWNGKPGRRERVGNGEDILIPFRFASVLGTIQPEMIERQVFSREDNGMTGRMLLFWPDLVPRERPKGNFDVEILERMYGRLASLKHGIGIDSQPQPIPVVLETDAADHFKRWWQADGAKLHKMADGLEKGAHGKFPGHVLRVACVLEHMWWAVGNSSNPPTSVSLKAARSAIALADQYFGPMLSRTLSAGTVMESDRLAVLLATKIIDKKPSYFTRSDITETWGLRLPALIHEREKVPLIESALTELINRGWLRVSDK